ncbi:MAG: maleylpyruvate isomerase N-terminal domain-containing protein [Acidimicrobiales bacterium]
MQTRPRDDPLVGVDVLACADEVAAMLRPALGRDWSVAVPDLDFTVASVVAHAATAPLWYSLDLWGGPGDYAAFEVGVRPDAEPQRLLNSLLATARACAAGVDAASSDTRGFHPAGSPDPEGFAAMACDELMVHGHDAARGLGLTFVPDSRLAARTIRRLFPWHSPGSDPWETLLWANGRVFLDGRTSQDGWVWHCAPLAEWDGAPRPLRPKN